MQNKEIPLFVLKNIQVLYKHKKNTIQALCNVSLSGHHRKTLGIVGESGCGKSTLCRILCLLEKPTRGKVYFDGIDVTDLKSKDLFSFRKKVQFVFQDVDSSLNPRMTVFDHIKEALFTHNLATKETVLSQVGDILHQVRLPKELAFRYPHELSGGQKQRVSIGRALSVEPKLLICDEPVSSLDVSIRREIIDLFLKLKKSKDLSLLFITHDLSTLPIIADQIAVMYLGSILEIGSKEDIYTRTKSPYTQALLSSIPDIDPKNNFRKKIIVHGELPSPMNPPNGCPFHTRCPIAKSLCREIAPELTECEKGHFVACHFPEKI